MDFWLSFLPIIIYLLLIVILIVGIILGIRLINTINRVDKVVDDVNDKVQTLNGFFNLVDFTTDKIVSITDKDEANLVVSMYAWASGVESIITRIDTVAHAKMLHKVNMDITVSPSEFAANKLYKFARSAQMEDEKNEILKFYSICDSLAEIMEFDVTEKCEKLGVEFRDKNFKLKKDTLVASIIKDGELTVPGGSSKLVAGDKVVIVSASKNKIKNLNEIFK